MSDPSTQKQKRHAIVGIRTIFWTYRFAHEDRLLLLSFYFIREDRLLLLTFHSIREDRLLLLLGFAHVWFDICQISDCEKRDRTFSFSIQWSLLASFEIKFRYLSRNPRTWTDKSDNVIVGAAPKHNRVEFNGDSYLLWNRNCRQKFRHHSAVVTRRVLMLQKESVQDPVKQRTSNFGFFFKGI